MLGGIRCGILVLNPLFTKKSIQCVVLELGAIVTSNDLDCQLILALNKSGEVDEALLSFTLSS